MSINDLVVQCHGNARNKGFWSSLTGTKTDYLVYQEKLLRLITEVSELAEGYRNGIATNDCDKVPGLSNEAEEVADIFIRLADFSAARGIDLELAIEKKMQYNATRPHLHGKEF